MAKRLQNPQFMPICPSSFEYLVGKLCLLPEDYASSLVLKDWVRRNKDNKYVPSQLLEVWGFTVNDNLYDLSRNHG